MKDLRESVARGEAMQASSSSGQGFANSRGSQNAALDFEDVVNAEEKAGSARKGDQADASARESKSTSGEQPVKTRKRDRTLAPGVELTHIKSYEILGCIGEGGMGWVYRAYDPVLERDVALKVMKPDVPEHQRKRFRQEAIYGARFSYPAIARVYDLVDDPSDGEPWFAMEYLSGKDLAAILQRSLARERPIPLRLIHDVFRQILGALAYSHQCSVVHRDVKPANMFVTRDPNTRLVTTKLLDFGVALDLSDSASRGLEQQLVGDPRYMAPEQTRLGEEIDHRVDLYAAGMCLYELVTGRHAFEDLLEAPMRELVAAHRERVPIPMSNFMPPNTPIELAQGLDEVFERSCAKAPADRYESGFEMQAALHDVLQSFWNSGEAEGTQNP